MLYNNDHYLIHGLYISGATINPPTKNTKLAFLNEKSNLLGPFILLELIVFMAVNKVIACKKNNLFFYGYCCINPNLKLVNYKGNYLYKLPNG